MSHMEISDREVLLPVEVPWRIASATPFLKMVIEEFRSAEVSFVAGFSLPEGNIHEKLVTVTIEKLHRVRVNSMLREEGGMDERNYDWSRVPLRLQPDESVEKWGKHFNEEWLISGFCPDPKMYQIQNSKWLAMEEVAHGELKHFLLIGEAFTLDIVAKNWTWTTGDVIDWTKE